MGERRTFLAVALTSLCVLTLELTLTRLFSATMFHHFAFLAISLALFGLGASGVLLYVLGPRLGRRHDDLGSSVAAALFAASAVLALVVILGSPLSPYLSGGATVARLSVIYGAAALPFFFAGWAVTVALTRFAPRISRLYFFDLGGAGVGCLLFIPSMNVLGAVNTVLLVAALAAVAALLFDLRAGKGRPWRVVLALLAAGFGGALVYNRKAQLLDVTQSKGLEERGNVIFSKWNSFSRVTVWGSLDKEQLDILIDSDASTAIRKGGADLQRHQGLRDDIEALAHHVAGKESALIIGPGGGDDVLRARLFGVRSIAAVELNPLIARDVMSSEPFRSYSGALYEQPGVRLLVDEGRSYVRRSRERYDLIQGTMVDTWAASAAGAFTLSENSLYTVEAFVDYAVHLSDDGLLTMTRWYLQPPDQLLRLVSLTRVMMRELGLSDPSRHVMVVRGGPDTGRLRQPATFLFKKSAFTDAEVRTIEAVAARRGYELVYTPLTRPGNDFTRLIQAPDPAEVWRSLPSNVAPTRDNSPFFFQTTRLSNLLNPRWARGEWRKTNLGTFVLFALLGISAALVLAFIVGPLALARGRLGPARAPGRLSPLLYFACLGAGFILVEVATIQKCVLFLGHPVYALTVVLFSLLVFSGVGSQLSGRFDLESLSATLVKVLAGVVILVVLYVFALLPLLDLALHWERWLRIVTTVALLLPLGLALGMPMPIGIRILADRSPEIIPWAWGLNGAASVLGSVAGMVVALVGGFDQTLLAGAGLYVLAALFIRRGAVVPSSPAPACGDGDHSPRGRGQG